MCFEFYQLSTAQTFIKVKYIDAETTLSSSTDQLCLRFLSYERIRWQTMEPLTCRGHGNSECGFRIAYGWLEVCFSVNVIQMRYSMTRIQVHSSLSD